MRDKRIDDSARDDEREEDTTMPSRRQRISQRGGRNAKGAIEGLTEAEADAFVRALADARSAGDS